MLNQADGVLRSCGEQFVGRSPPSPSPHQSPASSEHASSQRSRGKAGLRGPRAQSATPRRATFN
eukprot:11223988-Prorocentrum_lima.AAC.1